MNILAELFLTFAKIGCFTVGGGYAMIALIENNCVERKHWVTHDEIMNVTVIAQSTPGPIAINCATYVGYRVAGLIGSLVATAGIVLPSFLIILLISRLLDNFLEITWIANAFSGIKIAVAILILDAAVTMIGKMQKKLFPIAVILLSLAVMLLADFLSLRISSIAIMFAAALASLVLAIMRKGGEKK